MQFSFHGILEIVFSDNGPVIDVTLSLDIAIHKATDRWRVISEVKFCKSIIKKAARGNLIRISLLDFVVHLLIFSRKICSRAKRKLLPLTTKLHAFTCNSTPTRRATKTSCLQKKKGEKAYHLNLKEEALPELQPG